MSGRLYKARTLLQEGAICVIDTGATVLRVNQSKRRKDKYVWNDTVPLQIVQQFLCCVSGLMSYRVSGQKGLVIHNRLPKIIGSRLSTLLQMFLNFQTDQHLFWLSVASMG